MVRHAKNQLRSFKQTIRRTAKSLNNARKSAWKVTKNAYNWSIENLGPGSKFWTVAKVVVGVAALFACAVCAFAGYAALRMTAVDFGKAVHDGDPKKIVWEGLALASFGVSKKLESGYKGASAAFSAADDVLRTARQIPQGGGRVLRAAERGHAAAAYNFAHAERRLGSAKGLDFNHFELSSGHEAFTCNWTRSGSGCGN